MTKMKGKKRARREEKDTQCWHFNINLLTVSILFFALFFFFFDVVGLSVGSVDFGLLSADTIGSKVLAAHSLSAMHEADDECLMHADSCGISRLSFGKLGDKCK